MRHRTGALRRLHLVPSIKMETNVTPKHDPGNFFSPTLLFFSAPSFSTHTPLLKLPCPSQKNTRDTAGSITADKRPRKRKRPRWKLWQGCNEQRTCGVVLQTLSTCGPTYPRREHQSGELYMGRCGWRVEDPCMRGFELDMVGGNVEAHRAREAASVVPAGRVK